MFLSKVLWILWIILNILYILNLWKPANRIPYYKWSAFAVSVKFHYILLKVNIPLNSWLSSSSFFQLFFQFSQFYSHIFVLNENKVLINVLLKKNLTSLKKLAYPEIVSSIWEIKIKVCLWVFSSVKISQTSIINIENNCKLNM